MNVTMNIMQHHYKFLLGSILLPGTDHQFPGAFVCQGRVVELSKLCDGVNDCLHGADEKNFRCNCKLTVTLVVMAPKEVNNSDVLL